MSVNKSYNTIIKTVQAYEQLLHQLGPDRFEATPPIGGWSYSEVYCHIFDSSLLSVMALDNCIRGNGELKPTALMVKVILFFGMLPPGKKYKAPPKMASRVKKIGLTAAQQFITDFELQLAQVYPKIKSANLKIKTKHPVLGYLNAAQWLSFIEIHLKHHLKQLKRIQNSFKQQS
jgi:hypothetical protein